MLAQHSILDVHIFEEKKKKKKCKLELNIALQGGHQRYRCCWWCHNASPGWKLSSVGLRSRNIWLTLPFLGKSWILGSKLISQSTVISSFWGMNYLVAFKEQNILPQWSEVWKHSVERWAYCYGAAFWRSCCSSGKRLDRWSRLPTLLLEQLVSSVFLFELWFFTAGCSPALNKEGTSLGHI